MCRCFLLWGENQASLALRGFMCSKDFNLLNPKVIPMITMKISSLPSIIPTISTINVASFVAGPVIPIDRPTVLSEKAVRIFIFLVYSAGQSIPCRGKYSLTLLSRCNKKGRSLNFQLLPFLLSLLFIIRALSYFQSACRPCR